MPNTLFILNDSPCGTERSDNALRLAGSLSRDEDERVRLFLIGDADLADATHRSSLEELTSWVQWADRTLVF